MICSGPLFLFILREEKTLPALKECSDCGNELSLEFFGPSKFCRDGLRGQCKICRQEYYQRWKAANPDKYENQRWSKMRNNYGISKIEYLNFLTMQASGCAICGGVDEGKLLAVDHCHTTGLVRGLLCGGCNLAIGNLKDNPNLARRLADYLEETS